MRILGLLPVALALVLLISAATPGSGQHQVAADFDKEAVGIIAPGFTGHTGDWRVVIDDTAPSKNKVLAQLGKSSSSTFNVVMFDEATFQDVDVSVQLRAIAGRIDQGGGVLWRAQDKRNYYVARYNPLEDNLRIYFVKEGQRVLLRSADVGVDHKAWHTLRVRMRGGHVECFLDGVKYLDASDSTFGQPGRVGLWTKADAQTHFDSLAVSTPGASVIDPAVISDASQTEAKTTTDGTVRISWARADVPVSVSDMPLTPAAGLTSWAAFKSVGSEALVMGDTVVFEDEVSPAMDAAFAAGLSIAALHNHFLFDEPKVYFMHVGGQGDPRKLATAIRQVWTAIQRVREQTPQPANRFPGAVPTPGRIDAENVARILKHPVTVTDGVVRISRGHEGRMHGVTVGEAMGLSTWAAFSGNEEVAAVDGDFMMTADQVQPVLRTLRKTDIHVVALHNHMIGEEPTFYFTHFWGIGRAADLARAIRSALDVIESSPRAHPAVH